MKRELKILLIFSLILFPIILGIPIKSETDFSIKIHSDERIINITLNSPLFDETVSGEDSALLNISVNNSLGNTTNVSFWSGLSKISGGAFHTCALNTSGDAFCWGDDNEQALGDGNIDTVDNSTPYEVVGNHKFIEISSGYYHTCALNASGDAFCWEMMLKNN
jgi:alpha-tubulin suppressor-like RCC1 family protein